MKRQSKQTKNTKNTIFSFIVGALVALAIFFFLQNPEFFDSFQANVLSIQDKDTLIEHERDVGYKTQDGVLDVYLSSDLLLVTEIDVEILFSEGGMDLNIGEMEHQGSFEIIVEEAGRYVFKFTDLDGFDFDESLFVLPFTGNMREILLGQVSGLNDNLRVGNLNIDDKHRN